MTDPSPESRNQFSVALSEESKRYLTHLREVARLTGSGPVTAQQVPGLTRGLDLDMGGFPTFEENSRAPQPADGEVYWLSPDMVDLTADAARALTKVHWAALTPPSTTGIAVLAHPVMTELLLGVRAEEGTVDVPVRALYWCERGEYVFFATFIEARSGMSLIPVGVAAARRDDQTRFEGLQPPQLLAAMFMLIEQSGVTTAQDYAPTGPPPRRQGGRTVRPPKPPRVRVVNLRPGSDNAAFYDQASGKGRDYRHRFVVRGHVRQQPYPSLGEGVTKPIWIAPYLKGPEGAPLLTSPKVMAVKPPKGR